MDFDTIIQIIIPIVLTTIVTLILMARKDFSLTRDTTAKSAFTLESVQIDLTDLKKDIKEEFATASSRMDKRMDEMRAEFKYIIGRIEAIDRDMFNLRWRLEQLEKKNGGSKAPI